uniref:DUF4614 domain-containing protein n=1 Tax=Ornithorhynchus anatinus TaxID=9258 RepID=F6QNZ1_ORNAN
MMFSSRKTNMPKGYRLASDCFSHLSEISFSDSEINELKNSEPQSENLMETSPDHNRFLKKKQITANPANDSKSKFISSRPATTPSTIRAKAALMKLAQMETRIKNRKLKMDLSDSDSDLLSADQRPTSKSNERSPRGSQILEKKAAAIESTSSKMYLKEKMNSQMSRKIGPARKPVSLGSNEEEGRQLVQKFVKSSSKSEKYKNRVFNTKFQEKEAKEPSKDPVQSISTTFSSITEGPCHIKLLQLSSLASENLKTLPQKACSRTPSPRRHSGTEAGSLIDTISRSPSPSIEDYFARPTALKMEHRQLASASERSEVESLDELFSDAARGSSNDFRANIFSLDDLVSTSISERPELEQKDEDSQLGKSDKGVNSDVLTLKGVLSHPKESRTDVNCPVDVKEVIPTETEISEHLNEDSSALSEKENAFSLSSASPEPPKSILNSLYSEDFERYSDSPAYEQTVCSRPSPDITLQSSPESSSYSRTDTRSSRSSLEINKKWSEKVRRVTVKEMGVQTHNPAFAYRWVNGSTATIGPTLGGAYVDPTPVASHMVSADAVEALTAYSPAAFALNDMLKQQLMLTQQFVETSRHLHFSLLESLEDELFQYQTLEETKEYIKNHKPPPLTIEKALEEVVKEMGEH